MERQKSHLDKTSDLSSNLLENNLKFLTALLGSTGMTNQFDFYPQEFIGYD